MWTKKLTKQDQQNNATHSAQTTERQQGKLISETNTLKITK